MKTTLSFLVAIILFLGINKTVKSQENEDLVGIYNIKDLTVAPYNSWFDAEYQYTPNQKVIDDIKNLQVDFEIKIILGTWCSDSQTQVPRFIKILDEINYNTTDLLLICLNRDKKVDNFPIYKYNIERVPTFIIYRGDVEIGRIIETPTQTLEQDLLDILSK